MKTKDKLNELNIIATHYQDEQNEITAIIELINNLLYNKHYIIKKYYNIPDSLISELNSLKDASVQYKNDLFDKLTEIYNQEDAICDECDHIFHLLDKKYYDTDVDVYECINCGYISDNIYDVQNHVLITASFSVFLKDIKNFNIKKLTKLSNDLNNNFGIEYIHWIIDTNNIMGTTVYNDNIHNIEKSFNIYYPELYNQYTNLKETDIIKIFKRYSEVFPNKSIISLKIKNFNKN